MLAYMDHPGARDLLRGRDRLDEALLNNAKRALSLVAFLGGDYPVGPREPFVQAWYSLTGNSTFIGDLVSLTSRLRDGVLGRGEVLKELIHILAHRRYSLADLSLASTYLKLTTDMNLSDLGILVLYENPRTVALGLREPSVGLPNKLISMDLEVEVEGKGGPSTLRIRTFIIRQGEGVEVVDWSNPGPIPYSRFFPSGRGLADPVFASLVLYGVKVVTRPTKKELFLVLQRPTTQPRTPPVDIDGQFVALPLSMRPRDAAALVKELRELGYTPHLVEGLELHEALAFRVRA